MSRLPEKYDIESDVVVVGYGGAGATSAITAHDNGADVIILEKMPNGGGNTRVCGGMILVPKGMEFAEYLNTLSYKTTDREIIDAFVAEAMKHMEWFKEMGGELVPPASLAMEFTYPKMLRGAAYPHVRGAKEMQKSNVKGDLETPPSKRLWGLLSGNVERRKIKVMTGTRVQELLKNDDGEVVGVIAEKDGKKISVKAKKAVILTCGGYENDDVLKWGYLPAKPVEFAGNPGNTGDGIRMAQKIGADLWHMTSMSCMVGFQSPEYEAAFAILFPSEGFILVDKLGKRFVGETQIEVHEYGHFFSRFDPERLDYPTNPCHAIFDEDTRKRGPLTCGISGFNRDLYKWSPDNSAEIAKGWIVKARTIPELAKKISVDEATLEKTIANFNQYCQTGKDVEYGRPKEDLRAIKGPPYYAIEIRPMMVNTQGGPRRDKEARIIDANGKPIPRLYSAGEFGSIWGFLYQGSNNISECVVFGKIAWRNAAAQQPLA